ncbi:SOS response-associated peptidase [Butyrivibrio sp. FCS014]|uniref:SOS response-associated peptidase n=1 Tax=Butyrivibrio sp. FCS014 TaxID=1408304 RepID=UPI0004669E4A|nr:SOS response-associated peptidase family protein [Butyrivibrio sp. FCS014]
MCARYVFWDRNAIKVEAELGLGPGSLSMPQGDVCPGMTAAVIIAQRGDSSFPLTVRYMNWGILDKSLVINARAESVAEKPMFADSFAYRRCVMPAGAFYEWDSDRNKATFYDMEKDPVYLAGVYTLADNRDSFVVITTKANESMIKVHDRMPLMIPADSVKDWLYDDGVAKKMLLARMPQLLKEQEYEQLKLPGCE